MKVVALFEFYLPYFLPRTAEWSEAPYLQNKFDVEGQLVHVHPRKADEELFPSPIDKLLADSKIKVESDFIIPVGAPDEIFVRDRCFDRIEAQVYGEVTSRDDCRNPELAFAYRRSAISACNNSFITVASRVAIPRSEDWFGITTSTTTVVTSLSHILSCGSSCKAKSYCVMMKEIRFGRHPVRLDHQRVCQWRSTRSSEAIS